MQYTRDCEFLKNLSWNITTYINPSKKQAKSWCLWSIKDNSVQQTHFVFVLISSFWLDARLGQAWSHTTDETDRCGVCSDITDLSRRECFPFIAPWSMTTNEWINRFRSHSLLAVIPCSPSCCLSIQRRRIKPERRSLSASSEWAIPLRREATHNATLPRA